MNYEYYKKNIIKLNREKKFKLKIKKKNKKKYNDIKLLYNINRISRSYIRSNIKKDKENIYIPKIYKNTKIYWDFDLYRPSIHYKYYL